MDPLTQATLGAAVAAVFSSRDCVRRAIIVGALAGAAPDVDVFIRSETDPMLALEYHRHFTHAILFAPVIGLIVAALYKGLFFWKKIQFLKIAPFAVVGALTHGLLDACTSYGTLLYLPFSKHRESWDIISIIDPIFTIPLVVMTICAFRFRKPLFAKSVIGFCLLYLCFGVYQRERAQDFAEALALQRGHTEISQLTARPSFANTILWRIVYRVEDRYFVDAVQLQPFSTPVHYVGSSVDAFTVEDRQDLFDSEALLGVDIERFRFFSQGYLYRYPGDEQVLGDLRYAMFPDSIQPLWGIRVDSGQSDAHTEFVYYRDASKSAFGRFWKMIQGKPVDY